MPGYLARTQNMCAESAGSVRILSTGPITPLAIVSGGRIATAGRGCCVPFSKAESYEALDAWGRRLRTAKLSMWEYYDASDCRELYMSDEASVALWTSQAPPELAAPLAELPALQAEIAEAMQRVEARSRRPFRKAHSRARHGRGKRRDHYVDSAPAFAAPFGFEWRGRGKREAYVVVGGPQLVVFRRGRELEPVCIVDDGLRSGVRYTPRSVAQLDDTAGPELVFKGGDPSGWGDYILAIEEQGCRVVAQSIGGSTA